MYFCVRIIANSTGNSQKLMKEYTKFLKEVEILNHKYASIYFNVELEPLVMPFWSVALVSSV